MTYRKFWMTNGNGQTIQFADSVSKIFLNNPTGLGVSNTLTSNVYANQLNVISSDQSFNTIGGEYIFYDVSNADKYSLYNDFVTFLTYKPLTLYYQIPTSTPKTYSIDVEVLSIEKTEVKTDGMLRCSFQLQTLSRWRGAGVIESYRPSGTLFSTLLDNDSHMPVGVEITMTGTDMENPYITFSQNSEVYGEAKFDGTFSKVYVNSKDGIQTVELEQGGSVLANPLSYQDLSISNGTIYVTFIKLAKGSTRLQFGIDSGSFSNILVRYNPIYRSV